MATVTYSRRRRLVLAVAVTLVALLGGCVKPTTFNPYAAPDHDELDRLQRIINDRPDLEVVKDQMATLDGTIRATIAKHSPQTELGPEQAKMGHGCTDPFGHNIGDAYTIENIYARPAPTPEQWQQISADLDPALKAAGFRLNIPTTVTSPLGSNPQIRDDGATIDLINRPGGNNVLNYAYSTGCHLPASWRTAPPPSELRPPDDPGVHYPYLYGSPGGRTASAR